MFKIFALLGVLGSRANVLRPCFERIYDAPDSLNSSEQAEGMQAEGALGLELFLRQRLSRLRRKSKNKLSYNISMCTCLLDCIEIMPTKRLNCPIA